MKSLKLLSISLSLCILFCSGCRNDTDEPVFYCVEGKICCSDETISIPWEPCNGEILQVCKDGNNLCVSVTTSEGLEGLKLEVYSQEKKEWTILEDIQPYSSHILCCDGYIYYRSDRDGEISRVKINGTESEQLGIYHNYFFSDFIVSEDRIYTIHTDESGSIYNMEIFSLSDCLLSRMEITVQKFYRLRLSGGWLYQYPAWNYDGQIEIYRSQLSHIQSDSIFQWEEKIDLDYDTGDYERWGAERLQFYADKILYESPNSELMLLLPDGQRKKLWNIPADHDSVDFEPCYYFGSQGLVVVYEEVLPPIIKTENWSH